MARAARHPIWKATEYCLWIAGFLILGYCTFGWLEAKRYQAQGNRELDIQFAQPRDSSNPRPASRGRSPYAYGSLVGRLEIPRLGLSGKLLILTTLFVMIAEVLIYVPTIANHRTAWLSDRLSAAYTAALVLSVLSLFPVIAEKGLELDSIIEIVSCVLTAAGLYYSFTGDAQGWFNA